MGRLLFGEWRNCLPGGLWSTLGGRVRESGLILPHVPINQDPISFNFSTFHNLSGTFPFASFQMWCLTDFRSLHPLVLPPCGLQPTFLIKKMGTGVSEEPLPFIYSLLVPDRSVSGFLFDKNQHQRKCVLWIYDLMIINITMLSTCSGIIHA